MQDVLHILLVEDDSVDAEAVVRACKKQQVPCTFTVVADGIEALQQLRAPALPRAFPRRTIILLDLNMPRMNGIEFLHELRQDPALKHMIVFVLTTSNHEPDRIAAYDQRVAGYFLKSRVGTNFSEMITLLNFYQRMVEFPPQAA